MKRRCSDATSKSFRRSRAAAGQARRDRERGIVPCQPPLRLHDRRRIAGRWWYDQGIVTAAAIPPLRPKPLIFDARYRPRLARLRQSSGSPDRQSARPAVALKMLEKMAQINILAPAGRTSLQALSTNGPK
jgi:hypothetical protein